MSNSDADAVCYLNDVHAPSMSGDLVKAIEGLPGKMQKAPPGQWLQALKSAQSKGVVKQMELNDSGLLAWLDTSTASGVKSLTREELLAKAKSMGVTVKEVVLGSPRFRNYSHVAMLGDERSNAPGVYQEILLIANSERANVEDRIEQIEFEMEQFNFDLELLSMHPERIMALEQERSTLMTEKVKAYDFPNHHFSQAINGKHGKNLLVHARVLRFDDVYLIEEVQSDWGQQGRSRDWKGIMKGPFVTDTKAWAGLMVRRLLQRAALDQTVNKVVWIRSGMSNGGRCVTPGGQHDEFYMNTLRSLVDKSIGKCGGKTKLENLTIGEQLFADLPCFEMTPQIREGLKGVQPLYSLTGLSATRRQVDTREKEALLAQAKWLIGSRAHVQLLDKVYDVATGRQVAGKYINKIVQASLQAASPKFVLDHECFHYAFDQLLTQREREIVANEFAPGSNLNARVRDALFRMNERPAADQCANGDEAAAHGFALWSAGRLSLDESPVRGIFASLKQAFTDVVDWIQRTVLEYECTTSKDVFEKLRAGGYTPEAPGRSEPPRRYPAQA